MLPDEVALELRHEDVAHLYTFDETVYRVVCTVAGYGVLQGARCRGLVLKLSVVLDRDGSFRGHIVRLKVAFLRR